MNEDCRRVVERLALEPHPEGGWFRRTYTAPVLVQSGLACGSAIYYLLEGGDFSAFHRLSSDEVLHHYGGAAVTAHLLDGEGYRAVTLGGDIVAGQAPQLAVPAGTAFALSAGEEVPWALLGCTVFPEFSYGGWEMPPAEELAGRYPQHAALIRRYTRE